MRSVNAQVEIDVDDDFFHYTGGTHLALQDIKLPEGSTAGGYCYKDSTSVLTRNRFIYWYFFSSACLL